MSASEARREEAVIRNIRLLGAAIGGLVGLAFATSARLAEQSSLGGWLLVAWVVAWIVVGFALLPYLTVVPAGWLLRGIEKLSTAEFVTAVAGLLIGLLMGLLLGLPLSAFPDPHGTLLPLGVSLFLGLGMLGLTVAKRQDLLIAAEAIGLVRRPVPEGEATARSGDPQIVVDTSAIIDGRIAEIVESGFIYGTLVVPKFVLDELQHIADSSDTLRRNRGRRGLEILARMQKDSPTPIEIVDEPLPEIAEVDAKLVALARVRLEGDPHERLQPQPGRRAAGRPRPERQLARERRQTGRPAGRGAPGPGHPGGQGGRPGRRLPRGRDDDRGRRRRPLHRQGSRRDRDPRSPDGRGADDLRPASPRLTRPSGDDGPAMANVPNEHQVIADAVIVAAGSSARMGGVDKLAAEVGGRPLLAHAVAAFASAPEVERIVIVTAAERVAAIAAADWLPDQVIAVVAGGSRRQESVQRGVEALIGDGPPAGSRRAAMARGSRVVLVHDGARPLVSASLVSAVARAAHRHGAAIPTVPVGDTIKRLAADGTVTNAADRAELAAAQTPQGIRADVLAAAWGQFPADGERTFTDEAALLEACRIAVHAIPGDPRNFKVTLPDDLVRVRAALGSGVPAGGAPASDVRVGIGLDGHPFGPGRGLALGGIVLDRAPRLFGHSDGDVVLHAVADALLGAAGLGDLGRLFPAGPETPRGVESAVLLASIVERVTATGLRIERIDCTVVAGRPRLAAVLPAMGERIAAILGIDPDRVNIKASTGNLDGMEGAGRGISAQVVAVLAPSLPVG